MKYLLENKATGERSFHEGPDRDGYPPEEWGALAQGDMAEPVDHATFDRTRGRWSVDEEKKAEAEEAARLRALPRDEFMAEVEARIKRGAGK